MTHSMFSVGGRFQRGGKFGGANASSSFRRMRICENSLDRANTSANLMRLLCWEWLQAGLYVDPAWMLQARATMAAIAADEVSAKHIA